MTHRERILQAFEFKESDRVPIDLSGHRSSGIAAMAYPRLRKFLDLDERPVRVYDPVQQLAVLDRDILDHYGVDTIELGRAFALDDSDWVPWVLPDGTDCFLPVWVYPEREENRWVIRADSGREIARMPDGATFFEQTWYPFYDGDGYPDLAAAMEESMWHKVASPPGPLADGDKGKKLLANKAAEFRKSNDRAVLGLFGGNLLESGQMLYRNDNFLLMLAMDPPAVHDFLDRLVEKHLEDLEGYLPAVGDHIDIIVFGDDLGMQTGPQMSPEMYREYFKPRHRLMWERVKELADVKIMLHCCGGVRELLPDLIDAGLEAINPVQFTARGMDVAELKKEFGREMVFWGGGCDTQHVLPNASPQEVYEHVQGQLEILVPGGGFVFQQVHNVMHNVPPENIDAMLRSVNDFG